LIDYPTAKGLQSLATKIYANGGIMSSVCHGPAIYPGVIDEKSGDSVIKGKTITGFTTEGEYILKIMDVLKTWKGVEMVEEIAARLGAKCKST
jgi:putative intracellular protease/amidase